MATPSVREMKDALAAAGVPFADCSEKSELVARYRQMLASAASRPKAAAAPKAKATASHTSRDRAPEPPKQLSIEEMGKQPDGTDGGELGAEIRRVCSSKDFYQILKVERSCKAGELKKAYRKLALRLHPDKCHLSGAEEAFKKVSTAFSCLHDSRQRASYDVHGEAVVPGGRGAGAGFFRAGDVDAEELFRAFCGDGEGFKVENVLKAIKNNPWVLLALITEPPVYPFGLIAIGAVLSQIIFIMELLVQRPYLMALPIAGYFCFPEKYSIQIRRSLQQLLEKARAS
eukprot:TRINITY_DN57291_c0_g1_i1.p1 TRINITY_DN57291_c0_g1~~TRINITY_DN57291_c0_g1_i1.p1  ORF type:complete len:310 (+),score=56.59 TRINITY_DN57291_c0_g1_i1:71-931(+)